VKLARLVDGPEEQRSPDREAGGEDGDGGHGHSLGSDYLPRMKTIAQSTRNDCGIACLAILDGIDTMPEANDRFVAVPAVDKGINVERMRRKMKSACGFTVRDNDWIKGAAGQELPRPNYDALILVHVLKDENGAKAGWQHWIVWDSVSGVFRDPKAKQLKGDAHDEVNDPFAGREYSHDGHFVIRYDQKGPRP
jgi:hypothetical protein